MFGLGFLGKLGALASSVARAWSPLALWPDGIATPGMWISPRDLTSQWADYTGTTPVATPGTVADSANPVGLALDIRAGATVLTGPGNHMLQSTSTSRPLLSARVNLLTYTEDLTAAVWSTSNNVTRTVDTITATGTDNVQLTYGVLGARSGSDVTATVKVKKGISFALILTDAASGGNTAGFDGATGAYFASGSLNGLYPLVSYSCVTDTDPAYWLASATFTSNVIATSNFGVLINKNKVSSWGWSGCCSIGDVLEFGDVKQYEIGSTASAYQPILTDGSTYPSTGFPIAQKYDGVDDGMATAAFVAGTLINGMDCMIAVRRDSAKNVILGPYQAPVDLLHYVGNAEIGYNFLCYTGVGSPTVWVDNVQLTNGWASELHTAVTVGDWHIVEFRGLDLSSWVGLGLGLFGIGYNLFGPRGDIMLYPSTTPTADKDAARQWLADYYGVTLP